MKIAQAPSTRGDVERRRSVKSAGCRGAVGEAGEHAAAAGAEGAACADLEIGAPPQAESASSSLEEKQTALEELRRKIEAHVTKLWRQKILVIGTRAGLRQHCERALEARRLRMLQLPSCGRLQLSSCAGDMAVRRGKGFCELSMVPMASCYFSQASQV